MTYQITDVATLNNTLNAYKMNDWQQGYQLVYDALLEPRIVNTVNGPVEIMVPKERVSDGTTLRHGR